MKLKFMLKMESNMEFSLFDCKENYRLYQSFSEKIEKELWSFHQTLAMTAISTFIFKSDKEEIFKSMKEQWSKLVHIWNLEHKNRGGRHKTKASMAIIFIFVVLPYDLLDDVGKYFTDFEAININICHFYHRRTEMIPFLGQENILKEGDKLAILDMISETSLYDQWLDNKYNDAIVWVNYMVCEKNYKLNSIISSKPSKLIV